MSCRKQLCVAEKNVIEKQLETSEGILIRLLGFVIGEDMH
jgi:hypothetical protein